MTVQTADTMYTYIREIKVNGTDLDLYKKLDGEEAPARVVASILPTDVVSIRDDNRGQ
jgi:hypothetical protein